MAKTKYIPTQQQIDQYNANRRKKWAKNPELNEKNKIQTKKWLVSHPQYRLWKRAKDSSKQRNLEFNIIPEDIIIPEYCPYLGIRLTDIFDGGRQDTNISLDRIDNSKGYIKDNIRVVSSKANFMKRNASIEELIAFANGILKVHAH